MLSMKERRQFERFAFPPPVRLETITLDNNKVLDLETRDISASGTFINTLTSCTYSRGALFRMEHGLFWTSPYQVTALKNLNT